MQLIFTVNKIEILMSTFLHLVFPTHHMFHESSIVVCEEDMYLLAVKTMIKM